MPMSFHEGERALDEQECVRFEHIGVRFFYMIDDFGIRRCHFGRSREIPVLGEMRPKIRRLRFAPLGMTVVWRGDDLGPTGG